MQIHKMAATIPARKTLIDNSSYLLRPYFLLNIRRGRSFQSIHKKVRVKYDCTGQEQSEEFYPFPLMISLCMGIGRNDLYHTIIIPMHIDKKTYSLRENLRNVVIKERHYNKSKLLYTKRSQNHKMHPFQPSMISLSFLQEQYYDASRSRSPTFFYHIPTIA